MKNSMLTKRWLKDFQAHVTATDLKILETKRHEPSGFTFLFTRDDGRKFFLSKKSVDRIVKNGKAKGWL